MLTARAGRAEDAARLVGAATGERHPWPPDRFETCLERNAREAAGLEPAAWERGVAEGRQLSAPARLELALA